MPKTYTENLKAFCFVFCYGILKIIQKKSHPPLLILFTKCIDNIFKWVYNGISGEIQEH